MAFLRLYLLYNLYTILLWLLFIGQPSESSFYNLLQMMKCTTGRGNTKPMQLFHYGCWCGPDFITNGHGEPVDEVDQCCQNHDNCYARSSCPDKTAKLTSDYDWKCIRPDGSEIDVPLLGFFGARRMNNLLRDDNYRNITNLIAVLEAKYRTKRDSEVGEPVCEGADDKCGRELCDCDQVFSNCVKDYLWPSHKECGGPFESLGKITNSTTVEPTESTTAEPEPEPTTSEDPISNELPEEESTTRSAVSSLHAMGNVPMFLMMAVIVVVVVYTHSTTGLGGLPVLYTC